jgi:arylsulfatase A-like enzyme
MATTADMLGIRLLESAAPDSVSFLPALRGARIPPVRAAVVHHSQGGVFAIRQGQWKLILGAGSGGQSKPSNEAAAAQGLPDAQLYDLAADPGETRNQIATHRVDAARLSALLQRYVAQGRSTPGPAQANDVPVKLTAPASLAAAREP